MVAQVLAVLAERDAESSLKALWAALELRLAPSLNVSDHGWMPNHNKKPWQYVVRWSLTQVMKQGQVENPRRGFWRLTQ